MKFFHENSLREKTANKFSTKTPSWMSGMIINALDDNDDDDNDEDENLWTNLRDT